MKPYMIFDRNIGPIEGAGLVFAHTAREAKKVGWQYFHHLLVEEYIDIGIRLIKDSPWLFKEMKADHPHGIIDPKSCQHCGMWGNSEIDENGLCKECKDEELMPR